jgi:hypothetical protein
LTLRQPRMRLILALKTDNPDECMPGVSQMQTYQTQMRRDAMRCDADDEQIDFGKQGVSADGSSAGLQRELKLNLG